MLKDDLRANSYCVSPIHINRLLIVDIWLFGLIGCMDSKLVPWLINSNIRQLSTSRLPPCEWATTMGSVKGPNPKMIQHSIHSPTHSTMTRSTSRENTFTTITKNNLILDWRIEKWNSSPKNSLPSFYYLYIPNSQSIYSPFLTFLM